MYIQLHLCTWKKNISGGARQATCTCVCTYMYMIYNVYMCKIDLVVKILYPTKHCVIPFYVTPIYLHIDPYPYPQANGDQVSTIAQQLLCICSFFGRLYYTCAYKSARGMQSTISRHEQRYWIEAAPIEYRRCKYCYKFTFLLSSQLVDCIDVVGGHMLHTLQCNLSPVMWTG